MGNLVIGIVLIFIFIFGFAVMNSQKQISNPPVSSTKTTVSVIPTLSSTQGTVPLPTDTDIIRSFFSLISSRRASDAVGLMSESITQDDSAKQAWGVQLNAMKSVKIVDISPPTPSEWKKDEKHVYKVTLEVLMDPSSKNAPIPYYGWENGTNIRWITMDKPGKMWKIKGIGTGP